MKIKRISLRDLSKKGTAENAKDKEIESKKSSLRLNLSLVSIKIIIDKITQVTQNNIIFSRRELFFSRKTAIKGFKVQMNLRKAPEGPGSTCSFSQPVADVP
jgi:hypothetical protein